MRDTSAADRNAPESIIHLFVTYYTDTQAQVVHVPDECYLGNGYSPVSSDVVRVSIPQVQDQPVAVKVLTFERSAFLGRESPTVMYTFHVNGRFAAEAKLVTAIHNDPHCTHGYFSKVEVSFGSTEASPSPEKSVEAGKRVLQKILPVLVQEHWPDWNELEGKSAPAGGRSLNQAASSSRGH